MMWGKQMFTELHTSNTPTTVYIEIAPKDADEFKEHSGQRNGSVTLSASLLPTADRITSRGIDWEEPCYKTFYRSRIKKNEKRTNKRGAILFEAERVSTYGRRPRLIDRISTW